MTKSELFTFAWEIARNAQAKFGGKVSEYFAMSLKFAYQIDKQAQATFTYFRTNDTVYKISNSWKAFDKVMTKGNEMAATIKGLYILDNGVYSVRNRYFLVSNNKVKFVGEEEIVNLVA